MRTVERARGIIAEILPQTITDPQQAALSIVEALREKRIAFTTMAASADLFVRFHAHCRYLGSETGDGYEHWYNEAIAHAVRLNDWPCKLVTKTVNVEGQDITVDVQVPESTRRANNRQLLLAYEVIDWEANRRGISLPENMEETQ